jgi:hypothetical protein
VFLRSTIQEAQNLTKKSHTKVRNAVVGKRLPPLQSHAFEWVRDWVRVIAALHHAIDKVEKPSLDGIRHHDPDRPHQSRSNHHLISFLLLSFVS